MDTIELAKVGNYAVEKKYNLSYEAFAEKHLFANYPVVLGDACKAWKAKEKFTTQFFKKQYGDREVWIEGKTYKLADYIDLMETATEDNPAPYPCKLQIDRDYPELIPDVSPRFKYAMPDWCHSKLMPKKFLGHADTLEIFFGSPGGMFPYVHYDYLCLHAYITQIQGYKEFTVIPPNQTEFVYPVKENSWVSEIPNIYNIDFKKFPKAKHLTPITFTVGPGETLFIPCGWWHTAKSLTPTISIAQDSLNQSNFNQFQKEVEMSLNKRNSFKSKLAKIYLNKMILLMKTLDKKGIRV